MSSLIKGGESFSLTKEAPGLTKAVVGLGWDPVTDGKAIDLDAMAFLVDGSGKLVDQKSFVFFSNLQSADGSVVHSGDNLTGEGDGDDETITIDLPNVPTSVEQIVVAVYSYSGQPFTEVANVAARVVNGADNTELVRYEAGQLGDVKGVELGRLKRDGSDWTFEATGATTTDDLKTFTGTFGFTD
jgi:tellurium resistance protein TerD